MWGDHRALDLLSQGSSGGVEWKEGDFSLPFSKWGETFILYQQPENGTDSFLATMFCAGWEVIPASTDKRQCFVR